MDRICHLNRFLPVCSELCLFSKAPEILCSAPGFGYGKPISTHAKSVNSENRHRHGLTPARFHFAQSRLQAGAPSVPQASCARPSLRLDGSAELFISLAWGEDKAEPEVVMTEARVAVEDRGAVVAKRRPAAERVVVVTAAPIHTLVT